MGFLPFETMPYSIDYRAKKSTPHSTFFSIFFVRSPACRRAWSERTEPICLPPLQKQPVFAERHGNLLAIGYPAA
jgi:hypothetical protein